MSNGRFIEMTGATIGQLTVVKLLSKDRRGSKWETLCTCGTVSSAYTSDLRSGHLRSCGCYRRSGNAVVRHGHNRGGRRTRTYGIWSGMLKRCETPTATNYRWYGEKGVKVCARWHTFASFLAGMGEAPEGLELDRIDNKGHYEKGNCRWVTHLTNCQNRGGKFAVRE